MIKWLKKHKKISYLLYILIIVLVGIFFCLSYKKQNAAYSIEFEANSKFALFFNNDDIVIEAKCLNEFCHKNIKINDFLKINYKDLERQLDFTLYNELNNNKTINIKLSNGEKDISNLVNIYKSNNIDTELPNIQEQTKEEESNSTIVENDSSDNTNTSNKVENKPNNNHTSNNTVENNDTNSSNSTTSNKIFTPLDIEIIWIPTSYSYYRVSFDSYSTTPMGYNKKNNGAIPYKYGDTIAGYMQIFDLKNQGITTDDACITFTQNKYYNHEAAATTIVPLYNNKTVSYRKFCLGFDEGPYYYYSYDSIAADVNNSSNVYEWINNKWNYIGTLGNLSFTERNTLGYTQHFSVLDYIDLAYERIKTEQYPVISIKQRNELDKIEQEEDIMEEKMYKEQQEIAAVCGPSLSDDITDECELRYAEYGNKWTYERGIIEENRSEILGWDFDSMYDFSILDEK